MTRARVIDVAGQAGDFTVSLRQEPRYVVVECCIDCSRCAVVCPTRSIGKIPNRIASHRPA